jgi:cytochrome c peroxidase
LRFRTWLFTIPVISLIFVAGCNGSRHDVTDAGLDVKPIGAPIEIKTPLGLPPVPIPPGAPETAETVALGRKLFYERKLSMDNTLACASCHNPLLGFTDGQRHSIGVGGKVGIRNAPTLVNAAYVPAQFWDGRAHSLEEQAGGPMANPIEMNQAHEVTVSKLAADPVYRAQFAKAFGAGLVTIGKVTTALAGFERTLISGNSPFDQYEFGGNKSALSPAAVRGLAIFRDPKRGNCAACHTIDKSYAVSENSRKTGTVPGSPPEDPQSSFRVGRRASAPFALFTDGKFHNIGVGVNDEGELTDLGRYSETKLEADKGAFKTPTLRNVAKTAPYMHDGSLKTLKDVVDFYAGGGNSNPYLDKEIKTIKLSGADRADLVEFLKSLTGEMPPNVGPPENTQMGRLK